MNYPYYYIVKNKLTQPVLNDIFTAIAEHREYIEMIRDTKHEKSKKIELTLAPTLKGLGFCHSVTNKQFPLFKPPSQFEVDFYHPDKKIAIEIERSNLYTKVWLALYKMLESSLVSHGIICVPIRRIVRNAPENSFELTAKRIRDNTENLLSHLDSLIVLGY
ncbi:MAG: hypothetical protein FH749_06690 [Firmicutes bacterium]|nr:hypothetical protein [Bacillota bacterium]